MRKYKGVYLVTKKGGNSSNHVGEWQAVYKGRRSSHKTEREAAIKIDKCLIEDGKPPVNILKRK